MIKMRIGIVGIGHWGKKLIDEYSALKEEGIIEDVIACDIKKDALQSLPSNVTTIDNYHKMISMDMVDAVHIASNNYTHYTFATEAIEHEKHVLLEKPMATSSKDAYHLVELSSRNGTILQVGHIFRFANVMRDLKRYITDKYFGDIRYISTRWTNLMPPIPSVDIVWDLLPHQIDIIHFLTDKYPSSFRRVSKSFRRDRLAEASIITLDYDDFIAGIKLSWVTPKRSRHIEIVGSERMASVDAVGQKIHVISDDGNKYDLSVEVNNTIRSEILNFIESIKTGKMPFNSHIIGARNTEIVEKIAGGEYGRL